MCHPSRGISQDFADSLDRRWSIALVSEATPPLSSLEFPFLATHGSVTFMDTIREIRLSTGLSHRGFASKLGIPFETYRPLDSGRRQSSRALMERGASVLEQHRRSTELHSLDLLAHEYYIHPRTVRAAARDGRLTVQFANRAVYGRAVRLATRESVERFMQQSYRQRYSPAVEEWDKRESCPLAQPAFEGLADHKL